METFTAMLRCFRKKFGRGCKIKLQLIAESSWRKNGRRWPKGRQVPDGWAAFNQLWRAYQQVEARNDYERVWYAKSLDRLDQLGDYRRLRLLSNRAAVPTLMWVALLATLRLASAFSSARKTALPKRS